MDRWSLRNAELRRHRYPIRLFHAVSSGYYRGQARSGDGIRAEKRYKNVEVGHLAYQFWRSFADNGLYCKLRRHHGMDARTRLKFFMGMMRATSKILPNVSIMSLPDPRYTTDYAYTPKCTYFHDLEKEGKATFYLPASVNERWCRPGYQPKRPDKGIALTINDYYWHQNRYGDSWSNVAYTSKY